MADPLEKLTDAQGKNFVKQNILRAKCSYSAEPKWRSVDTRHGNTYDLKRSGLHPIYIHKKVRVPATYAEASYSLFAPFMLFLTILNYYLWFLSTQIYSS